MGHVDVAAAGTVTIVAHWTALAVDGVPTGIVNAKCAVVTAGVGIGSITVVVAVAAAFDDSVSIENTSNDNDIGCIVEDACYAPGSFFFSFTFYSCTFTSSFSCLRYSKAPWTCQLTPRIPILLFPWC